MASEMTGGRQCGRIRYVARIASDDACLHHFAIETALPAWLDTAQLPGKRLDENPATVDRWMPATGKLPE